MKAFRWGFVTLVFVYLYLPIALLVINSFNVSKYGHEWRGFSLKWYEKLAGNDALMQAFTNSLVIATLAATAATIIGTLMALAIYRYRFPLRKTASGLLFVVMLSPDIVLAITFLVIFIALGIQLGFWSLLIAHITFCLPFVVVTVLPAVVASWLLSFTLSLDDVIISSFVTGPGFEILPIRVFSMVKVGVSPEVNVLATLLLVISLTLVTLSTLLLKRKKPQ
ncbi:MAG: spermidine/putrescine ABC transporter permease PotC [Chromatiales bacterium]|jgi:spermidine/putrescine transport system permease protein